MSQPSFRARYCEKQINDLENIIFIRWANGFSGIHSKAIVQCATHGNEWSASPNNLFAGRSKCPKCHIGRGPSNKQIDSIPNVAFVRWVRPGSVRVRCRIDGFEYECRIDELIANGGACHVCAESGLTPYQRQTLYVLRSACGESSWQMPVCANGSAPSRAFFVRCMGTFPLSHTVTRILLLPVT